MQVHEPIYLVCSSPDMVTLLVCIISCGLFIHSSLWVAALVPPFPPKAQKSTLFNPIDALTISRSRFEMSLSDYHHLPTWINSLKSPSSYLMIDGDNVRGKTKFMVTKMQLLRDIQSFLNFHKLSCVVFLYFDHGMKQESLRVTSTSNSSITVVFSGPAISADDVIVADISKLRNIQGGKKIILVSEDSQLLKRCRIKRKCATFKSLTKRISSRSLLSVRDEGENLTKLLFVSSPSFIKCIYNIGNRTESNIENINHIRPHSDSCHKPKKLEQTEDTLEIKESLSKLQAQFSILIQLQTVQQKISEEILAKGIKMFRKDSPTLVKKFRKLSFQLQSLSGFSFDVNDFRSFNELVVRSVIERAAVLLNSIPVNARSCLEESWERIILTEEFRLELHNLFPQ